jgi:hypothetical protein
MLRDQAYFVSCFFSLSDARTAKMERAEVHVGEWSVGGWRPHVRTDKYVRFA